MRAEVFYKAENLKEQSYRVEKKGTEVFAEKVNELKKRRALERDLIKKSLEKSKTKDEIQFLGSLIQKDRQDIGKRKLMKNQYWKHVLLDLSENKLNEAANGYLDSVPKLIEKKFFKQSVVGLILSITIQIKENRIKQAKKIFEIHLKEKIHEYESLPEFKMIGYLIDALENNEKTIIDLIINQFLEKLILFKPEVSFLKKFINQI